MFFFPFIQLFLATYNVLGTALEPEDAAVNNPKILLSESKKGVTPTIIMAGFCLFVSLLFTMESNLYNNRRPWVPLLAHFIDGDRQTQL